LPPKPDRNDEQAAAAETIRQKARTARQRFLSRHVASVYQALLERDVERCGARVDPADENATRATPASGCAPSLPATASNSHVGMAMSIRRSTAESD